MLATSREQERGQALLAAQQLKQNTEREKDSDREKMDGKTDILSCRQKQKNGDRME